MNNKNLDIKVLQIGEGNFLRAFAEYIIETADNMGIFNGSVVISQARGSDFCDILNLQNCDYNILTRGIENGETVDSLEKTTCVKECINPKKDFDKVIETACLDTLKVIISNTTEAGIVYNESDCLNDKPPVSFPAKLTVLLYSRFKKFDGSSEKGLLILPVELIEKNGDRLKEIVLKYADEWQLDKEFVSWINNSCCFANTLVDRIVSGYPKDSIEEVTRRIGYDDKCVVACEPFLFWAIECDEKMSDIFPVDKLGLNIVYSSDITAYKTRKVRILNGAHTLSVLAGFLSGHNTVREMMQDSHYKNHIINALYKEIIPTINLPFDELSAFADSVIERFDNPFIKHKLLDISLNSVSKFKSRCLGSMKDYIRIYNELPKALTFGLASLISFYRGEIKDGRFIGNRNGEDYEIRDSEEVIAFMSKNPSVEEILSREDFWGENLNKIDGLCEKTQEYLTSIQENGIEKTVEEIRW